MVMGLWKPVVILPDIPLENKELDMILTHKLVHLKRRDFLVKLMVLLVKTVHWFNPLVYFLSRQLNTLCELSCDEKVVREMDTESPISTTLERDLNLPAKISVEFIVKANTFSIAYKKINIMRS